MTREEAIRLLDLNREYLKNTNNIGLKDDIEALDMAIKALEREPCEDCISKQAAIEICKNHGHDNSAYYISLLPSVTPKTDALDKIRAYIKQGYCEVNNDYDRGLNYGLYMAEQIIKQVEESGGK